MPPIPLPYHFRFTVTFTLTHRQLLPFTKSMSIEFGWWSKSPEDGKFQINVSIHGGNITWLKKQGHNTSWEEYGPPTDDDWEKLLYEADRRVPRRLISPKQFEDIKRLRER